jgi:hypothetical protein
MKMWNWKKLHRTKHRPWKFKGNRGDGGKTVLNRVDGGKITAMIPVTVLQKKMGATGGCRNGGKKDDAFPRVDSE